MGKIYAPFLYHLVISSLGLARTSSSRSLYNAFALASRDAMSTFWPPASAPGTSTPFFVMEMFSFSRVSRSAWVKVLVRTGRNGAGVFFRDVRNCLVVSKCYTGQEKGGEVRGNGDVLSWQH